jgi:hypothetical protein
MEEAMNHVVRRTGQSIFSVILALSSAACAVNAYQPALTGSMARLRVVTAEAAETQVFVLPDAQNGCVTKQTKEWQWFAILGRHLPNDGLQGVTIGISGSEAFKPVSVAEATIPAEKPFSMYLVRAGYNYTCPVDLTFVPRVGVDYEASFSLVGRMCQVSVAELKRSSDGSVARSRVATSSVEFCKL